MTNNKERSVLQQAKLSLGPMIKVLKCAMDVPPSKNWQLQKDPTILHCSDRAYCKRVLIDDEPCIKKVFTRSRLGRECFLNERQASTLFADCDWSPHWIQNGINLAGQPWFARRMFPIESRLDQLASQLDRSTRWQIARSIIAILREMYNRGVAHRDCHAKNVYVIDGVVKIVDFEFLLAYPIGAKPDFRQSFDVVGQGLPIPQWHLREMAFFLDHPESISTVLGVDVEDLTDLET